MINEEALLEAAKNNQRQALVEIYDTYHTQLYAYAYRTLMDADQAEECVAATFQRFLEILQKGKGPDNHLRAYLYRIAHNWMMDEYRRSGKEKQFVDIEEDRWPAQGKSPSELVNDRQAKRELLDHLQQLTADQREVLVLRFLQEHSLQETAKIVSKPLGAVKALQNRAIKNLRKQYVVKDSDE